MRAGVVWKGREADVPTHITTTSGHNCFLCVLATRASVPSVSRRAKFLSAVPRKPLASSTSSANQTARYSARSRSLSHSTAPPNPSTSKEIYIPQDEEPEAIAFIELHKNASRQVVENSKKKQRVAAREKIYAHAPHQNLNLYLVTKGT